MVVPLNQPSPQHRFPVVEDGRLSRGDGELIIDELQPAAMGPLPRFILRFMGDWCELCRHGFTAVTHLNLHLQWLLGWCHGDPVDGAHNTAASPGLRPGRYHHAIHGGLQPDHVKRLLPGHTQTLALADGEVLDAVMLTNHRAVTQHDLALSRGEIGVQEGPHGAMVIRQAKILAFRFFRRAQAVSRRFQSGVGFGELAEGEHDASQHVLGKVVEEVALVFAAVEPPQQLMPALCTAVTDPGVVACGNPGQPPVFGGPLEHRAELH